MKRWQLEIRDPTGDRDTVFIRAVDADAASALAAEQGFQVVRVLGWVSNAAEARSPRCAWVRSMGKVLVVIGIVAIGSGELIQWVQPRSIDLIKFAELCLRNTPWLMIAGFLLIAVGGLGLDQASRSRDVEH